MYSTIALSRQTSRAKRGVGTVLYASQAAAKRAFSPVLGIQTAGGTGGPGSKARRQEDSRAMHTGHSAVGAPTYDWSAACRDARMTAADRQPNRAAQGRQPDPLDA